MSSSVNVILSVEALGLTDFHTQVNKSNCKESLSQQVEYDREQRCLHGLQNSCAAFIMCLLGCKQEVLGLTL